MNYKVGLILGNVIAALISNVGFAACPGTNLSGQERVPNGNGGITVNSLDATFDGTIWKYTLGPRHGIAVVDCDGPVFSMRQLTSEDGPGVPSDKRVYAGHLDGPAVEGTFYCELGCRNAEFAFVFRN